MKNITLILLITSPFLTFGQVFTKTFSPNDSITKKGYGYITHDILFDLDKKTLKDTSNPILDSIAYVLQVNDSITVEVQVHKDSRSAKYDQRSSSNLTMNRAKTIVDYLNKKGIDPKRLVAKGYNSLKPIISDKTISQTNDMETKEKYHAMNRRVEFVVLNTDFKKMK